MQKVARAIVLAALLAGCRGGGPTDGGSTNGGGFIYVSLSTDFAHVGDLIRIDGSWGTEAQSTSVSFDGIRVPPLPESDSHSLVVQVPDGLQFDPSVAARLIPVEVKASSGVGYSELAVAPR